jgi:H+-transporting ATPase
VKENGTTNVDLAQARTTEVLESLQTNLDSGLSEAEAQRRLAQYGPNEVAEKRKNPFLGFLKKFWGLSAWMIEAIILLSWVLHRYADLYIVTALLVVNAMLSFMQEQRASGVVQALKKQLRVNARVLRDGVWKVLSGIELAPGDIVRIRAGDLSPADIKIVSGQLGVDQSALTGESLEVEKSADGLLYAGSVARRGEANGVVIHTGARTYFGRTTELVQLARPKLHIEGVVSNVVRWLLLIVGVLLAVAILFALLRGIPLLDILPLLLVLLLGAVPVALPVMFTVSMAVGSMELAHKGVLVTRLSASEDAATMDILCVDKTGTITANQLSVAEVIPLNGASADDAILYGYLASQRANQDPIDLAFIAAAEQAGLQTTAFVQQSFAPFDPHTRRTEATIAGPGGRFRVTKGAIDSVAQACHLDEQAIRDLEVRADGYARKGYRALAVARSNGQDALEIVGLVTLYDKPRPDSAALIAEIQAHGVAVKMLTGDALPIAQEIARGVGLGENVSKAADLEQLAKENLSRAAELAENSDGFAEIYPEGKYTVVRALQAKGHVVGMTGDGVNDAPALRQAEVGIAVSNATDVAKGAASVVLTQEGLSEIIALVENGREIYQRIITWIINKISRTILKSVFVVGAFLITGKFVVSALAMLLMVLMTDFVKISLSTDNVRPSRSAETWNILGPVKLGAIMGVLMTLEAMGLLFIGLRYLGLEGHDQALYTFSFVTLLYFAIFSLFVVRERGHFWSSMPSRTLLLALGLDLVAGTVIASVGIPGLAPLPLSHTLLVMAYAFVCSLLLNDLIKYVLIAKAGTRRLPK